MKMIILVGLPGSGKSTFASHLISQSSERFARINYDEIRWFNQDGSPKDYQYSKDNEKLVKMEATDRANTYVTDGYDLVIDNTNLTESARNYWKEFARRRNMEVEVKHFNTDLDECIRRNDLRTGWAKVPRAVIERMALFNNMVTWSPDREIVIVDADGTLFDLNHRKHFLSGVCDHCSGNGKHYMFLGGGSELVRNCSECAGTGKVKRDYKSFFSNCGNDPIIIPVARWVQSLSDKYICIVSGRPVDLAGVDTVDSLNRNGISFDRIFMRASGDFRDDTIIKKEILDKIPRQQIKFAIDDRPKVVRMWRENGIKCYDVGLGVEF